MRKLWQAFMAECDKRLGKDFELKYDGTWLPVTTPRYEPLDPWFPRTSEAAQRIVNAARAVDLEAPGSLLECWPLDGPAGTVAISVENLRNLRRALHEALPSA